MSALPQNLDKLQVNEKYEVKIAGERAWLIVRADLLESIEWENGNVIKLIEDDIDFLIDEQKAETDALYQTSREILRGIEKKGVRPVFTVPREFKEELLKRGLAPRPTWVKDAKLLASTIGIPYYNKEGNRLLCIPNSKLNFKDLNLAPRLTGRHPAVFQGVVVTEKPINISDLIVIDSSNWQIISNDSPEKMDSKTDADIIRSDTRTKLRAL